MNSLRLYLLAALPAVVCLVAWQGAGWTAEQLNCVTRGKELGGCAIFGVDITAQLGASVFWGGVLLIPAAFVSLIMFAAVPFVRRRATNRTPHPDGRDASGVSRDGEAPAGGRER